MIGTKNFLRFVTKTIFSISIFVIVFGILISLVESPHSDSNIKTYQDGVWWAFVSMATVGYGDHFPITTLGRVLGGAILFSGIAMFSLTTARISSYFVETEERKERKAIMSRINRVEKKLDVLIEKMVG